MSLTSFLRRAFVYTGLAERRCAGCLAPCFPDSDLPLCASCIAQLPRRQGGFCPHCGEMVNSFQPSESLPIAPCGACLLSPPPWQEFHFYGVFETLLRDILHRAKYQGEPAALDLSGRLLLRVCVSTLTPDVIIPMPLHPQRLRQRGFNQCVEMARPLARHWGIPLRPHWLQRLRHTSPQTGLTRAERLLNLNAVFLASQDVAHLRILLIDDTATTGTSLRRATEALLLAGAASVNVAVVARAARHRGGCSPSQAPHGRT